MPTHVLPWLPAAPPPQWPQNLYKKVHGRCDCIVHLWLGLSKRFPVLAVSVSQLCIRSYLPLDSEVSAELGEAYISDNAESFGSPQAVTGDRKTHRDCLIDSQCKPPSSDKPRTPALHCNPPLLSTHGDTDPYLPSWQDWQAWDHYVTSRNHIHLINNSKTAFCNDIHCMWICLLFSWILLTVRDEGSQQKIRAFLHETWHLSWTEVCFKCQFAW